MYLSTAFVSSHVDGFDQLPLTVKYLPSPLSSNNIFVKARTIIMWDKRYVITLQSEKFGINNKFSLAARKW